MAHGPHPRREQRAASNRACRAIVLTRAAVSAAQAIDPISECVPPW